MKMCISILFVMIYGVSLSQEICDNGIDDDFDGLIDLNDTTDCVCLFEKGVNGVSLIPNPSFETRSCCPSNFGQLACADSWIQASPNTSDYFNTCGFASYRPFVMAKNPPLPIPHGTGFVGYIDGGSVSPSNKEYVGTCLLDTMHAGTSYTIDLSMAYGRGLTTISVAIFGNPVCANLPLAQNNGCPTANSTPGWVLLDTSFVTLDTTIWNTVTFSFVPSVDITAIVVGPSCILNSSPTGTNWNTYYMDNLILRNSSSFIKPLATILDSGHYCSKNIVLKAIFDSIPNSYQWYKEGVALVNDTNSIYSVPANTLGNYSVRLSYDSGCYVTLPFTVDSTVLDFDISSSGSCLISSTTGQVFINKHRNGTAPYEFNIDGGGFQLDSTFQNLAPGLHTVIVRDTNNCTLTKTIQVDTFPKPVANFRTDSICLGEATTLSDLSSISSGSITEWNWGIPISTTTQHSVYTFSSDGSFPINLTVKSDSGCIHDTMIPVIVHPLPVPNFTFSPTEIFTFDTRVCFSNTSSGVVSYSWDFDFAGTNGSSNLVNPCTVTFPNDKSATYTVKLNAVSEYGCKDSVEYNLVILDGLFLFIPNSFSPNNDGINDEFSISSEGLEELELIIFNRWGEVIFKTNDLEFSWDGKYKGTQVPIDSYPYSVRVKTNRGYVSKKQGHITIIR